MPIRAPAPTVYQLSHHRLPKANPLASHAAYRTDRPTAENPLIVSASELCSFLRCRVQHHWRYQCRIGPKQTPERLAVGTLGHVVMETFYAAPQAKRTVKRMQRIANDLISTCTEKAVSADSRTLLLQMCTGFAAWVRDPARCEHTDAAIGLDTCIPEMEFDLPLVPDGSIRVRGKIDGVFESTTMRHTVGMLESKFLKDIKINDLDNRIQLSLYLWALRQLYPKHKRFISYYQVLRKQAPTPRVRTALFHREPIERTDEEIAQFVTDVGITAMDMLGGAVYPNPMDTCQWSCDFLVPCLQRGSPADLKYILKTGYAVRTDTHSSNTPTPTTTKVKRNKVRT